MDPPSRAHVERLQHMMQRSRLVDSLKAVAAMLIVLHHLVFYGPMADHLRPIVPGLWRWLASDARMAVQVFLVVAGFFAARSLAPAGRLGSAPLLPILWKRFLRLALPYHVILAVAIVANELARSMMEHDSISAPATAAQLLAHALLLNDLLGYEALSAGLWYVAMDMQLFLLMAGLLWLGRQADDAVARSHPHWRINSSAVLVALLGLASVLHFNRDYAWDAWVVYFFGAYSLGALAWWAFNHAWSPAWFWLMAAGVAAALLTGFRQGLLLALAIALLLGLAPWWRRRASVETGPFFAAIHWLGRISYSLFLVHFPVCLVVNAVFTRFMPATVAWQTIGLGVAVAASVGGGAIFHWRVEAPLMRRLDRPRKATSVAAPATTAVPASPDAGSRK